jgi:hypothetical protein
LPRRSLRVVAVLAVLAGFLVSVATVTASPQRQFSVTSESARYLPATGEVRFTIHFTAAPDFTTTDEFGRQANSFQYFVVGDSTLPYPSNYDSIIRGDEINARGTIAIRNATPPDATDPLAGGWGTVRGEVSYSLRGRTLTFVVPLELLTDQTDAARIAYQLETYEFGTTTAAVEGVIRIH